MSSPLRAEPPSRNGSITQSLSKGVATITMVENSLPMDTESLHADGESDALSASETKAIEQASSSILALWSAETDMLDRIAATYWRDMVNTKSAMDIKVMEHLEAVDAFQEREAGYKSRIAALERRLKELEAVVLEKDRLLVQIAGANAGTLARGEMTPNRSKETSPDITSYIDTAIGDPS